MSEQAPQIDLNFPLSGKVAVVTGGASGIGAAISKAFVAKGAKVAVLDISADMAKAKAEELGENARPFVCDVSSQHSVNEAIAAAVAQFGSIDIAVNSAGVVYLAPAEDISLDS